VLAFHHSVYGRPHLGADGGILRLQVQEWKQHSLLDGIGGF